MENPADLLKLTPQEEVEYTFIKTLQNQLKNSELMQELEKELYQKKWRLFQEKYPNFNSGHHNQPLTGYENLTPQAFKSMIHCEYLQPFVIKKFISHSFAVKNWSLDYFKKKYSAEKVSYRITQEKHFEEGLFGALGDILTLMQTTKEASIYINNTAEIFKNHPHLLNDIDYEKIKSYYHPSAVNAIIQLFLGGKNSGTELHCANEFNSFLMIEGRKRWTFIDPCYSYALGAKLSINALNAVTEIDSHTQPAHYYEEKHPLYNRIPRFSVDLEPGDMLVFPPWWWHGVQNLTDSTVAVATRWTPIGRTQFPRGNIIFQNIQRSNPLFQEYSKKFIQAVSQKELLGDVELSRQYFGQIESSKENQ